MTRHTNGRYPAPKRDISTVHVVDLSNVAVTTVATNMLGAGVPGNDPGTLIRTRYSIGGTSSSAALDFILWGIIGNDNDTAADLPDPTIAGSENENAKFLFIGVLSYNAAENRGPVGPNSEDWAWDIKAMRKLRCGETFFILGKTTTGTCTILSQKISTWWKEV